MLPPSEIGEVAVFARRNGDVWFLAVLNGPGARTINSPLSFLGEGEYQALLVRDRKDDAEALDIENKSLKRGDSLSIEMPGGGGFLPASRRIEWPESPFRRHLAPASIPRR